LAEGSGAKIPEGITAHAPSVTGAAASTRATTLLGDVGIAAPEARARDYPHQLSGGMRQRVLLAMALANSPRVVLADEPTTALDVTTQAQVLELFDTLTAERGASLVLVTHDLGVVAGHADRVLVIYAPPV